MSVARDVANALVQSGFWPGVNPHAVLTLCFLAEAEGHHPAVVYRDYHIMNGKPSKKAEAILRDFAAAGGKIEWHTLDDKCADATFTHPSGQARIEWTLDRANKAGLKSPMWNKYPRQMLRSRCISEGVRTVFPGATSGLYETNEVADIVAEERPANDTAPANQQPKREAAAPPRITGEQLDQIKALIPLQKTVSVVEIIRNYQEMAKERGKPVPKDFDQLDARQGDAIIKRLNEIIDQERIAAATGNPQRDEILADEVPY